MGGAWNTLEKEQDNKRIIMLKFKFIAAMVPEIKAQYTC